MSAVAESKVTGIIRSLGDLETDLDSLVSKSADMKKQLASKAQAEIEAALVKTREMALQEADGIISAAKAKANDEAARITEAGNAKLADIRSRIETNFDQAVAHVVSTVLKADP